MVYYMWNKPAMQVLIQAMRANTRIVKKFGEHNKTYTDYGIDTNDARQASMKRFALGHAFYSWNTSHKSRPYFTFHWKHWLLCSFLLHI